MAGFVRPTMGGPQRESDWAGRYAGATSELNNARTNAGQQNLSMSQMTQAGTMADRARLDSAIQNVIGSMQGAHNAQFQKDQLNQQRSAQRTSLGMQAGQMAVSGAMGVGGLALGAGNLAVNQGQLALAQQMWGTW